LAGCGDAFSRHGSLALRFTSSKNIADSPLIE